MLKDSQKVTYMYHLHRVLRCMASEYALCKSKNQWVGVCFIWYVQGDLWVPCCSFLDKLWLLTKKTPEMLLATGMNNDLNIAASNWFAMTFSDKICTFHAQKGYVGQYVSKLMSYLIKLCKAKCLQLEWKFQIITQCKYWMKMVCPLSNVHVYHTVIVWYICNLYNTFPLNLKTKRCPNTNFIQILSLKQSVYCSINIHVKFKAELKH